jgi:hypothetical protein
MLLSFADSLVLNFSKFNCSSFKLRKKSFCRRSSQPAMKSWNHSFKIEVVHGEWF